MYSLYGTVASSGQTLIYQVFFTIKGSALSGYSITKQPATGISNKAQITGQINRKQHTLTILETKSLDAVPATEAFCFFDAKLTYKLTGSKYYATGTYTSYRDDGVACPGGTVEFEDSNVPGSVFYVKKKEPLPEKTKTDTLAIKEPIVTADNSITEGVQKQIDWTSDTCVIEVWDGGIIDGDVISVLYNDAPVLPNYPLVKAHKQLRIPLTKKKSTVTIIAEDEGINPPNTADILLIDGTNRYKITAYNKIGKKAIIVLTKR